MKVGIAERGAALQLGKLATAEHQAAGLPKGFAYFINTEEVGQVVYFSPVASLVCSELLKQWGAESCSDPYPKLIFGDPAYGSL